MSGLCRVGDVDRERWRVLNAIEAAKLAARSERDWWPDKTEFVDDDGE